MSEREYVVGQYYKWNCDNEVCYFDGSTFTSITRPRARWALHSILEEERDPLTEASDVEAVSQRLTGRYDYEQRRIS